MADEEDLLLATADFMYDVMHGLPPPCTFHLTVQQFDDLLELTRP